MPSSLRLPWALLHAWFALLLAFSDLFELVARLPTRQLRLIGNLPAQRQAETGQFGVSRKVHIRPIFVGRLMVTMRHVIPLLFLAPSQIVAFEQGTLIHAEGRYA